MHVEIRKGAYGLPQVGMLAREFLEKISAKAECYQALCAPGLWRHEWHLIMFALVVEEFGVEYVGKEHV